jgi:hypothetical protein
VDAEGPDYRRPTVLQIRDHRSTAVKKKFVNVTQKRVSRKDAKETAKAAKKTKSKGFLLLGVLCGSLCVFA